MIILCVIHTTIAVKFYWLYTLYIYGCLEKQFYKYTTREIHQYQQIHKS